MKTTIALTAAAIVALPSMSFAGAHNEAASNDNRAEQGAENLDKVPQGLSMQLERGNTSFVKKPGKRDE